MTTSTTASRAASGCWSTASTTADEHIGERAAQVALGHRVRARSRPLMSCAIASPASRTSSSLPENSSYSVAVETPAVAASASTVVAP